MMAIEKNISTTRTSTNKGDRKENCYMLPSLTLEMSRLYFKIKF